MKQQAYRYRILVQPDERMGTDEPAYTAYVPTLGIASDGDSEEEAIRNAQEAIEAYIASLLQDNQPLPRDDRGAYRVRTAQVKVSDGKVAASPVA